MMSQNEDDEWRANAENELERLKRAMRKVRASTSWFASCAGAVSRDDAVAAVRGTLAALNDVKEIIDQD